MPAMLSRMSTAAVCLAACANGAVPSMDERIKEGECSSLAPVGTETYYPTSSQVIVEESADLFDIKYATTFKVVISKKAKEQYVLTQCGQVKPTNASIDAVAPLDVNYTRKHFTVPIQTSSADSTVQLGYLDYLGVRDRVSYLTSYAVSPCWQKALSCNSTLESAYGGNATLREQQISSVDVFFMDCGYSGCDNVNKQANGVHVPASEDPTPMKSAEYIKFFGAFFNKESVAKEHFTAVEKAYNDVKVSMETKPVVTWMQYSSYSKAFTISEAHYKKAFVVDAGGSMFDAETALKDLDGFSATTAATGKTVKIALSAYNTSASMTLAQIQAAAAAAIMPKLVAVDVLIDETYAFAPKSYTFSTFASTYGLNSSATHKFYTSQRVLRVDGTLSETDALDWYESRMARPDWAVEGLARVMHPEKNSSTWRYFRNIAKDEMPKVLYKDNCTTVLPVCDASAEPVPIKNPGDFQETDAAMPRHCAGVVAAVAAALAAAAAQ